MRLPRLAGAVGRGRADAFLQARGRYIAGAARAVRDRTRRSPATYRPPRGELGYDPARSSWSRACAQRPLVPRAGARRCERTRRARHRRLRLLRLARSANTCWRAATACGRSTSTRRERRRRRRDHGRRHPRPRCGRRARAPASTWCSTTSRRCRWPRDRDAVRSVNVGGTAVLLVAAPRPPVCARWCTRRRAPCTASPIRTRSPSRRRRRRSRPTAGPSSRPSSCAARPPHAGST